MRIIAKKTLREFWEIHSDVETALTAWYNEARKADWQSPDDVMELYPNARILDSNRLIFKIKGNHYRLVVKVNYEYSIVWIRFVGTHAAYDKIDAKTV